MATTRSSSDSHRCRTTQDAKLRRMTWKTKPGEAIPTAAATQPRGKGHWVAWLWEGEVEGANTSPLTNRCLQSACVLGSMKRFWH